MSRVLVVTEESAVAERLESTDREDAFEVTQTRWITWDVKTLAMHAADVFLLDYRNPGSIPGGITELLAAELREHNSQTPVIFVADFDPLLREMIQAAVGNRNVAFTDTKAFTDVNGIREVLATFAAHRNPGMESQKSRAFPCLFPNLRNHQTGRLDATRVSRVFGIPINRLAGSLGVGAGAVYKTPDSPALQAGLLLYERIARSLLSLVGSEEGLRIWLNTPEIDLDSAIPRDLLMNGEGEVVANLLEDMESGQPG